MSPAPPELVAAVAALWAAPSVQSELYAEPRFRRLRETCQRLFSEAGCAATMDFALARALSNLACPTTAPAPGLPPMPPEEAASRLAHAFVQTEVRRTYIAPLNMADHFPRLSYGPAMAGQFSAADLSALLQGPGGAWGRPHGLPVEWMSMFRWLVVQETTSLRGPAVQPRALPQLSLNFGEDFGRIVPHAKPRPDRFDDALFALLLLPWEHHDTAYNPEWRVFGVPWIYTVEDDLFARAPPHPDLDALSEEEVAHHDWDGAVTTERRPFAVNLEPDAAVMAAGLDAAAWDRLEIAKGHELFTAPLAHFFVRAFFAEPIDEFLAHISAVEAGLGLAEDHQRGQRRRWGRANPGATFRVAARLAALLGNSAMGRTYEHLFALRSRYLHGQLMDDIPSAARMQARELARRTVCGIVDLASSDGSRTREAHLAVLLEDGRRAYPKQGASGILLDAAPKGPRP